MIDFDRFWEEPGGFGGLAKEQAEEHIRQLRAAMAEQGASTDAFDHVPSAAPLPGVTPGEIKAWEKKQSVRLPDVLRQALAKQNGGYVRGEPIQILPLREIARPQEEDFWDYTSFEEEEIPNTGLIFLFAHEEESGGELYLNFNARGPQAEPSVMEYHSDGSDMGQCCDLATKFFERVLRRHDKPSVDWSETQIGEILAEETIDLSSSYGQAARKEQVVIRHDGCIIIYSRDTTPEGMTLSKTLLPEPLESNDFGLGALESNRVGYSLHIQPGDSSGIVWQLSQQTPDGRWKNSTTRGTPIMGTVWIQDRGRLQEIRRKLFGEAAAARAQEQDQRSEELQRRMANVSVESQQATGLAIVGEMMKRFFPEGRPKAENLTPQLGEIQKVLDGKWAMLEKLAQEKLKDHPVDPEVMRLFREQFKSLDDKKGKKKE